MKERDRQRRLEEAQAILSRKQNTNGNSSENQTFNRRANIMSS
jgi:hypothetical protein